MQQPQILFIDIETVAQHEYYENLDAQWQQLWATKATLLKKDADATPATLYNRAAIYAEFGKIVCISCGFIHEQSGIQTLHIKSFYGHNEVVLLKAFIELLQKRADTLKLCAHNGKEFDFPYIARRILINNLPLPPVLQLSNKKPWEVPHLDTMDMWKFGDFKAYTSLNLLAHCLGIPTPKDDIDGSMVYDVYYKEKNIDRIVTYCQKDVATLTNIYLRLTGQATINAEQVILKP
jgi:3'-5' exonuclease